MGVDISKVGVYLSDVFKCLVKHGTPLEKDFEYYGMPPMEGYIPIPGFENMYKIDRYQKVSYPHEQFIMSKLVEEPLVASEVDARTWKYWNNEDMVYCLPELTDSSYLWHNAHELTNSSCLWHELTDDSYLWHTLNVANDHSIQTVVLVGYRAEDDGTPFWWVRNSWGEEFGVDGYQYEMAINEAIMELDEDEEDDNDDAKTYLQEEHVLPRGHNRPKREA
jgi:hypothetical protein